MISLEKGDEIGEYQVDRLLLTTQHSKIYGCTKKNVKDSLLNSKDYYCLKLSQNKGRMTVFNEFSICLHLNQLLLSEESNEGVLMNSSLSIGIPFVYCYGDFPSENKSNEHKTDTTSELTYFMVTEYFVQTLLQRQYLYNQQYNSTLELTKRGLQGLKYLHHCGYIHGDVKPENIMCTRNSSEVTPQLKFIDFGLAQKIPKHDKTILKNDSFTAGTPRYASIRVHEGHEATCRDDVESWIYTVLFLYIGELPWQGLKKENNIGILESKKTSMIWFAKRLPDTRIVDLLEKTWKTEFDSHPSYDV